MTLTVEGMAFILAGMSALASGSFALISWRYARRSARVEASRTISQMYDRCAERRFEHPELLALGRAWRFEFLDAVYGSPQPESDTRPWGRYYAYAELCFGYCNSVLHAHRDHLLDEATYRAHHEPLVRLLLTENYPLVEQLRPKGYLSRLITEYLDHARGPGPGLPRWRDEHQALVSQASTQVIAVRPGPAE